jgi:hypothetical protein
MCHFEQRNPPTIHLFIDMMLTSSFIAFMITQVSVLSCMIFQQKSEAVPVLTERLKGVTFQFFMGISPVPC